MATVVCLGCCLPAALSEWTDLGDHQVNAAGGALGACIRRPGLGGSTENICPRPCSIFGVDLLADGKVSSGTQVMGQRTDPDLGASPANATPPQASIYRVMTYSEFCLLVVFGDLDKGLKNYTYWSGAGLVPELRRDWLARYADH